MGAQSLHILNQEKYLKEFRENIIYQYENYIMRERFRVGDGIQDEDELQHNLLFSKILCTDNCTMIDYIYDKINGKLEDCGGKIKKNQSLRELMKAAIEKTDCEDECCLINEACPVLEGSW